MRKHIRGRHFFKSLLRFCGNLWRVSRPKLTLKTYVRLLGILLLILGWLLANSSYYPSVKGLITPKYSRTISTIEKMNREEFILKRGDQGFSEVAELFQRDRRTMKPAEEGGKMPDEFALLKNLKEWHINEFATLKSEIGMMPNDKVTRRLTLRITSDNAPPQELDVADMRGWVEHRYSNEVLFSWGKSVFWAGVLIGVIGVFL